MKGAEGLIYAVVGTRRGGGGGVKGEVPRTRCSCGVRLWGVLFGVRLSCMSVLPIGALYDRGRVRCCQGGIFGNMTADAGWGGREWGNAKAQGRNEEEEGDSRLRGNDGTGVGTRCDGCRTGGIPAYAGMTGGGSGHDVMGAGRGIPAYAGMTCERVSSCRVGRTFLRS